MLKYASLQFLLILASLLIATCKPYGTKGGSQTKGSPEPEDEFDLGSGWEGFTQDKRPSDKGNGYSENKEIKFMNKHIDLENNDHLGSHGLGVGKVPHGTKSIGGKDNSYEGSGTSHIGKDIQYAGKDSAFDFKGPQFFKREETYEGGQDFIPKEKDSTAKDSIDKDSSYGGKDFIPKEKDYTPNDPIDKDSSYGGKGFIPKIKDYTPKDSIDKDSYYGGKDFIPKEKDNAPKDSIDKDSSYGGKNFIPKGKDYTPKDPIDKDSSYGGKDFIPKEKDYTPKYPIDKDFSYSGKDFIPKEKDYSPKDPIDKDSYGGNDFISKEKDYTPKDPIDKDSSYGGKDFIPKEKDYTPKDPIDKDSSYGGKDFIPKEKDYTPKDPIDKDSSYGGKDIIPKEKDYTPKDPIDKDYSTGGKDSTHKGKIPSFGGKESQGGKDVAYSYGKDKPVDNSFKEIDYGMDAVSKELGNRERPEKKDEFPKRDSARKDNPHDDFDSDEKNPGFFESFGTILKGLKKKIESIGNKEEKKAKSTLGYLKESKTEVEEKSENLWDKLTGKFWDIWAKVDRSVERGGQYVFQGFLDAYSEAKGSQLIAKLAQRLAEGDKVVDQFFKKVGEKVSKWLQQHGHDTVDEGLLAPEREVEEQFSNPQFPNLFQDIEIHQELDKLVQNGIMQQEEVDHLAKIQIVRQDKKVKVQENSSALYSDTDEVKKTLFKDEKKDTIRDDKLDYLKEDITRSKVLAQSSGSTAPKLPSKISEQLKSWVNSIDKLVSA